MITIESSHNKTYRYFKSLLTTKGLKKEGHCLVMGKTLTKELINSKTPYKKIHFDEVENPDYLLSKELFADLCLLKIKSPILLCEFQEPKSYTYSKDSFDVFLPVGDPRNIGALIRTATAFDLDKIVLLTESAHPFLHESIRASSGSVFKAPLFKSGSLKDLDLEELYTLDKSGKSLFDWRPNLKDGLKILLGEEGGGLNKAQLKNSISIPISKNVESLNVNSALTSTLTWLRGLEKP
jgi:tRNA G18 (ribose-2'-O)-methylase SpoU